MKTKNLLTGVALSAMFAACTQDVELNEAIAKNDFSNVPMVEAEFTVNTGAESRMATKFGWEVDDVVGFVWNGGQADGKAYANNPLYCTDAANTKFDGQSMYYVGKYFAYIPYAETLKGVDYVPFSIKEQKLSTSLADYAKHNIMISPKQTELVVLGEDETLATGQQEAGRKKNYPLYLSQLSNTAKIVLNFEKTTGLTDLKVTKVSLSLENNGGNPVMPLNFGFNATSYPTQMSEWNGVTPSYFFSTHANATELGELTLENEDGLAVTDNTLTTYAVVLPTYANTIGGLNVIVETNYGVITAKDVKVIAKGQTADKAAAVSLSTELFTKFGTTGTVVAKLDASQIVVGSKKVATQAELKEYLDVLAATKVKESVTITAEPATANDDKTFILNDFTLPENLKATITLAVDGTKAESVVFTGNTVINYPIVVADDVTVKDNMTIEYIKDAAYTFNCVSLTVDHDAVLTNNGKISGSINTVAADKEEGLGFGKYINNNKEAKLINGSKINNLGEAQWIAGTAPAIVAGTNFVYAEATDLAGIEAANNATVQAIRLLDGAWIGNNTEGILYDGIAVIECYGDVNFYVTDTPRNAANTFGFPWATILVMEDANLTINSDNKNNVLETGDAIGVKKNATLTISNIICNATVNNEGAVSLNNAQQVKQGYQGEGSSWISSENK